jgi:hypothetical protein
VSAAPRTRAPRPLATPVSHPGRNGRAVPVRAQVQSQSLFDGGAAAPRSAAPPLSQEGRTMRPRITVLATVAALVCAGAVRAQEAGPLQVHGYLTQGFGISDGGTILGIPTTGTTDYRQVALQFRYGFTPSDAVTIQLSHRRFGESPVSAYHPDLELNWAFYSHQFDDLTVKVGRVAIPSGIYNEVRNVGTVLPFYRVPFSVYLEGAFTSETVDGAVATYEVAAGKPWSAEVSGYFGGWNTLQRMSGGTPLQYVYLPVRIEKAVGGQAWVNTPLQGVRVGVGGNSHHVNGGEFDGPWTAWMGSLDAALERVTLRAEYQRQDLKAGGDDLVYRSWYAYLGVQPVSGVTLSGQIEAADLDYAGVVHQPFNRETIAGISWAPRANLVLKAEGHITKGFWPDVPVMDELSGSPAKVNYVLLSLSTSF